MAGIALGLGNSYDDVNKLTFIEIIDDFEYGSSKTYNFPAQFINNSIDSKIDFKMTWEGLANTTVNVTIKDINNNSLFNENKSITSAGSGITAQKSISGETDIFYSDNNLEIFNLSTSALSSSLDGSAYEIQIGANTHGWGDGFSATSGVAPGAELVSVRALGPNGSGTLEDIVRALNYINENAATYNIIIANLSLSVSSGITSQILEDAINNLADKGVIVVVAAGNDQERKSISSPGMASGAITVGAVNDINQISSFSSIGSLSQSLIKPDVVAPGGSLERSAIVSSYTKYFSFWNSDKGAGIKDSYTLLAGTSQAVPHVSGLLALMASKRNSNWAFNSSSLPKLFKMIISMSAYEISDGEEESPGIPERAGGLKDRVEGYGMICVKGALSAFDPNWSFSNLNISLSDSLGGQRTFIRRLSLNKNKMYNFSLSVPSGADFDLYLFSSTPDENGEPILLSSSALVNKETEKFYDFIPDETTDYYIVAKCVSGSGTGVLKLDSMEDRPSNILNIYDIYGYKDLKNKKLHLYWSNNYLANAKIQYGKTGGLESEENITEYNTNHSVSLDIDEDSNYYFKIISYPKDSMNIASSGVYKISEVNIFRSFGFDDLTSIKEVGGCGRINIVIDKNGYSTNNNKNILFILSPLFFMLLYKKKRYFWNISNN